MRNEQREHINRIREDFQANQRVKDSLNNSIKALADDLYSKDTHFIFELIQNAEDNAYDGKEPTLSFRLSKNDPTSSQGSDGALIIQNNEVGFSPENVDAICAVGKSTKKKAQGYIGEKGIGFKSVFRVTSTPHVFSNGYQFCLPEKDDQTGLGYIVPQWVEHIPDDIDLSRTTIVLPLDKTAFGYDKIKEMLCDIRLETILFLSKLKDVKIDTGTKLEILKDDSKLPKVELLVNDEGKESSDHVDEFLLYSRSFPKPDDINHEKRKDIKKREVSIAFLLNQKKIREGNIFAYLPVRSETGLPFSINADFILTSSREDIHWDLPWNQWLMRCVAELLADALPKLKEQGCLTVALLEMLVNRLKDISDQDTFFPIADAVRNALSDQELLPADGGAFVSAKNVKMVRSAELRKLLGDKQRQVLFASQNKYEWLSNEITQDKMPVLRTYLMKDLGVEEITPDTFARKITSDFLTQQSDDWMITFYQFLNERQEALWKTGLKPLREKPFIRLQDGSHVSAFKQDGAPTSYLPPQGDTVFPVVKRGICKDEKALEFLKKLGLTKPDKVAEVIEHIIPKYSLGHSDVSEDEHMMDVNKIRLAYSIDSEAKKKTLTEKLKATAFIWAKNNALDKTEYKKPNQVYFPNEELLLYFDGNKDVWFVSTEYDSSFHEILKAIGVADKVRITCKSESDSFNDVKLEHESYPWVYRRGLKGFDPDIQIVELKHAVMNPSAKRSKFIWNEIAMKYSHCIKGKILRCSRQDFSQNASTYEEKNMTSSFGQLLMNNPWLPDKQGKFHKPHDLKLDDLPESFNPNEKLADQLGMKKDVVAKLAEEAGISQDTLNLAQNLERQSPEVRQKIELLMQKDGKKLDEAKTTPSTIDYKYELGKYFNRSGEVEIQDQPTDEGKVNKPEHRRKKSHEGHKVRLHDEPNPDQRRKETTRTMLEGPDEQVREYLIQWYEGKCQICNKTFPQRNGQPFFVANYIVPRKLARFTDDSANALCLCADHFAKWQHGSVEAENIQEQISAFKTEVESESEITSSILRIKLCGENCEIKFKEKHLLDLQELLRASNHE